jgi:hypothetical protein
MSTSLAAKGGFNPIINNSFVKFDTPKEFLALKE